MLYNKISKHKTHALATRINYPNGNRSAFHYCCMIYHLSSATEDLMLSIPLRYERDHVHVLQFILYTLFYLVLSQMLLINCLQYISSNRFWIVNICEFNLLGTQANCIYTMLLTDQIESRWIWLLKIIIYYLCT